MAEFARWQWDDQGQWRDFAEQYQAEMEAAFQRRDADLKLEIPPFGTFRMDLKAMAQTTLKGRNPGYTRHIRRRARHIEAGYFILGHEGDIFLSDAAIDQIMDIPVLEVMARVVLGIAEDPENFEKRSLNLKAPEYVDTLGTCEAALEYLRERNFEEIEGEDEDSNFLVFLHDDPRSLRDALKEIEARLATLRKKQEASQKGNTKQAQEATESNDVGDSSNNSNNNSNSNSNNNNNNNSNNNSNNNNNDDDDENSNPIITANDDAAVSSGFPAAKGGATLEAAASNEVTSNETPPPGPPVGSVTSVSFSVVDGQEAPGREVHTYDAGEEEEEEEGRRSEDSPGPPPPSWSFADTIPGDPACSQERPLRVTLELPDKSTRQVILLEDTLDEVMQEVVEASGLRLPTLEIEADPTAASSSASPSSSSARWGLAAEPGVSFCSAANLRSDNNGDDNNNNNEGGPAMIRVKDFEATFVERLSGGLLRLQDLAGIAPLLDWKKPELPKLVLGRLRSFLDGSAEAWCKAADCSAETELTYGRALLRRLYGDLSLSDRLEVVRKLLPSQTCGAPAMLKVERERFLETAIRGLEELSVSDLRRRFAARFEGEVAEDHGGPRRDFFGNFGGRLVQDLPHLWRRLPKGAIVPVADLIAEGTPKEQLPSSSESVSEAYRACGRAFALAARYSDVMGEELAEFFLHQVARDDTVPLEELQRQLSQAEGDHDFRASKAVFQKPIAELGLQGLTLTRVLTHTEVEVELVPGGKDVPITEENKVEWLELHLHDKLYRSLRKAADAFREGLIDVLGGSRRTCPLLVLLSPAELAKMWAGAGVTEEQLRRWKEVAVVSREVQSQAAWFWELLEEADEEHRGQILKFTTGVHRLHQQGLSSFEVQPADGGDESLPRAMTCANMLQVPRYTSKAIFNQQLRKAIELCDGFQTL